MASESKNEHEVVGSIFSKEISTGWPAGAYHAMTQLYLRSYNSLSLNEAKFIDDLLGKHEFERIYERQRHDVNAKLVDEFLLDEQKNLGIIIRYMDVELKNETQKRRGYGYPTVLRDGKRIKEYATLERRISNSGEWMIGSAYGSLGAGLLAGALFHCGLGYYPFTLPSILFGIFIVSVLDMIKKGKKRDKFRAIEGKRALDILLNEYKT